MNSISFAIDNSISVQGADLFTTDAPCASCAQAIITAGIKRVYYDRPYRAQAIEMLIEEGIEVYQLLANGMLNRIIYVDEA